MFAYYNIFICIMMTKESILLLQQRKNTLLASDLNAELTPSQLTCVIYLSTGSYLEYSVGRLHFLTKRVTEAAITKNQSFQGPRAEHFHLIKS